MCEHKQIQMRDALMLQKSAALMRVEPSPPSPVEISPQSMSIEKVFSDPFADKYESP